MNHDLCILQYYCYYLIFFLSTGRCINHTFAVCKTCNSLAAWLACRRRRATAHLGPWTETIYRIRWGRWSAGVRRASLSSSGWTRPRRCLASQWARRTVICYHPDCFSLRLWTMCQSQQFIVYIVRTWNDITMMTPRWWLCYNLVRIYITLWRTQSSAGEEEGKSDLFKNNFGGTSSSSKNEWIIIICVFHTTRYTRNQIANILFSALFFFCDFY